MASSYFTLEHETVEILNQFPVLKDFSKENQFGLEEETTNTHTLLKTLQNHNFKSDEINIIVRKLHSEVDKLYRD